MFRKEKIEAYLKDGWLRVQKHPTADLYIYNYSAAAQYERKWDEVTLACRGLILNGRQEVVARPFEKFFNLGEMENQYLPKEEFEIFEKMDGSLGILYWVDGEAYIATRGSFISEQAMYATQLLHSKYKASIEQLNRSKTYLFEIIYPENRIVLDYGQRKELVLLGVVDISTGEDEPLPEIGFPVVKRYDIDSDLEALKDLEIDNKEGFVIRFSSGLRYKIKFAEYLRIHRIVTNVSNISIWEGLKEGDDLKELLDRVPDEFYDWVKLKVAEFEHQYSAIEQECKRDFQILENRKLTAAYFMECNYPAVLFKMLDEKNYQEVIWKMLRPVYSKPYFAGE